MTTQQIQDAIYNAFYAVVRIGIQPSQAKFFSSSIAATWPMTTPPASWPTFWYDSVAVEIQQAFLNYGKYLPDFDGDWLNKNSGKYKWSDVSDWASGTSKTIPGGITDY
jgi:hypothetical protein